MYGVEIGGCRVLVMSDGRVVAIGGPVTVLAGTLGPPAMTAAPKPPAIEPGPSDRPDDSW